MKERPILFSGPMVRAILDGCKTQTRRITPAVAAECLDFLGGHADGSPATGEDVDIRWGRCEDDDGKLGRPQWLAYSAEYPEEGCLPIGIGYGKPGDRLWVRETLFFDDESGATWYATSKPRSLGNPSGRDYGPMPPDDWAAPLYGSPVRAIHMPRWASRITLEITNVRVQRVQEISEADAKAEGARYSDTGLNRYRQPRDGWSLEDPHPGDYQHCLGTAALAFGNYWNKINAARGFGWSANPWVWVVEFRKL